MTQTRPLEAANRVLQSRGAPLPADVRRPLEKLFGRSLKQIRIHADEEAAQACAALESRAFAFGNQIALGEGERDFTRPSTFETLAHELAHCLQQRGQAGCIASGIGLAQDPFEAEAHEAAARVRQGRRVKRLSTDSSRLIRRIISAKPGTAELIITQRPSAIEPLYLPDFIVRERNGAVIQEIHLGPVVRCTSSALQLTGAVDLDGENNPPDPSRGWTLGMIQLQFVETNWGHYRGAVNQDGSMFVQRARPPARMSQACRDTVNFGAIFADNNPPPPAFRVPGIFPRDLYDQFETLPNEIFPVYMGISFSDAPTATYKAVLTNTRTRQPNYLHELQVELLFCSILSLRSPAGDFQHLKHLYWNVRWQSRFEPVNPRMLPGPLRMIPVGGGTAAHVSPVYEGGPIDRRFVNIITQPTVKCNDLTSRAFNHPDVQCELVWKNFDVRKAAKAPCP
ncbi:MAG: DUF4157 domain-containing protein [Acidobacteria bacterium]|nr:DUF4157 domain-containing protein [Acidobacteriota bacterium]